MFTRKRLGWAAALVVAGAATAYGLTSVSADTTPPPPSQPFNENGTYLPYTGNLGGTATSLPAIPASPAPAAPAQDGTSDGGGWGPAPPPTFAGRP